MPLLYDPPPHEGSLVQGEVLADVWEHQPIAPPVEQEDVPFRSLRHPMTLVLNPYCDLHWDHEHLRSRLADAVDSHKEVPYVFLCVAYTETEIRARDEINSALWKSISKNQNERFHTLPAADICDPPGGRLPTLCLDFKKVFAVRTEQLYQGLLAGVRRVGIVPRIYREDLFVRYGYYVARVSLPD